MNIAISIKIFVIFVIHFSNFFAFAANDHVCEKWIEYFGDPLGKCQKVPPLNHDVPSQILTAGYKAESYIIETKDGYILQLFRVLRREHVRPKNPPTGVPVLLVHSLYESSKIYLGTQNESLAYVLADAGYDVFLANLRGSRYSLAHVNYTYWNQEFWKKTSIDDIAKFDIPAILDYIEEVTAHSKILYVGHNVGSTVLFAYASQNPEDDRIKLATAITPVVLMENSVSYNHFPGRLISRHTQFLGTIIKKAKLHVLLSYYKYKRFILDIFFLNLPWPLSLIEALIARIYFFMYMKFHGYNEQITPDRAPYFLAAFPDGGSIKEDFNSRQFVFGKFNKVDYGSDTNKMIYGSEQPPDYDISKIKIPLFVMYTNDDAFVDPKNVETVYNKLSKEAKYKKLKIETKGFNNMAFLFGKDANKLVYKPILKEFTKVLPPTAGKTKKVQHSNPISVTVNNKKGPVVFPKDKKGEEKPISFTVNNKTQSFMLPEVLYPKEEHRRQKREKHDRGPVRFPPTPKSN